MSVTYIREASLRYCGPRRGVAFDVVRSPESGVGLLRRILPDNVREHFAILFLDAAKQVVGYYVVATGTAASCVVGIKEVFQAAIVAGAESIILGHNHPSGRLNPSEEDHAVTKRLCEAGNLLGVTILDHLIIGCYDSYSFFEHGELPHQKRG